ncbi:hypothetical protein AB0F02_37790, partial [Streptomyces sp. NPDC029554]
PPQQTEVTAGRRTAGPAPEPRRAAPSGEQRLELGGGPDPQNRDPEQRPDIALRANERHLADAYRDWLAEFGFEPTSAQFALWLQDQYGIATAAGGPLSDEQLEPLLRLLKQRNSPLERPGTEQLHPNDDGEWSDYFHSAWLAYTQQHGVTPDAAILAAYVYERDQITGADGQPITAADVAPFINTLRPSALDELQPHADEEDVKPTAQTRAAQLLTSQDETQETHTASGAHAAAGSGGPRVSAALGDPTGEDDPVREPTALTTVDRYYLAWTEYQTERGEEPKAEQLSEYLASEKGMTGRGGRPVSPSTLRRYLLPFRVYHLWAEQRQRSEAPSLDDITQQCAARGITGQHNKPLTADYIAEQAFDFERRWQVLSRHHVQQHR